MNRHHVQIASCVGLALAVAVGCAGGDPTVNADAQGRRHDGASSGPDASDGSSSTGQGSAGGTVADGSGVSGSDGSLGPASTDGSGSTGGTGRTGAGRAGGQQASGSSSGSGSGGAPPAAGAGPSNPAAVRRYANPLDPTSWGAARPPEDGFDAFAWALQPGIDGCKAVADPVAVEPGLGSQPVDSTESSTPPSDSSTSAPPGDSSTSTPPSDATEPTTAPNDTSAPSVPVSGPSGLEPSTSDAPTAVFLVGAQVSPPTLAVGERMCVHVAIEPSSVSLTDPAGGSPVNVYSFGSDSTRITAIAVNAGTNVITIESARGTATATFEVVPAPRPALVVLDGDAGSLDVLVAGPPGSTVRLAVYDLASGLASAFVTELPPVTLSRYGSARLRVAKAQQRRFCIAPAHGFCLRIPA